MQGSLWGRVYVWPDALADVELGIFGGTSSGVRDLAYKGMVIGGIFFRCGCVALAGFMLDDAAQLTRDAVEDVLHA